MSMEQGKMVDFGKYKSQIALPDFLIDNFDFVPVDGSSFCYPKLMNRKTRQVIVVKMNSQGYYTYFDVHNDNIRGKSIFDFLQNELSVGDKKPSLLAVAKTLDHYIESGKVSKPDSSKYYLTKSDNDLTLLLKEIKPLSDRTFLHSRGIDDSTIDSDVFKGVFMEREFIKDSSRHMNLIIKLFNNKGLAGLSQRNFEFKGCLLSRFDSLASSNFDTKRPIDIVFLGESMLDAASHFQMNRERLKDLNIGYISSEGSLAVGQIELLQKALDNKKPENLVTIFDKDLAGQEFNLKLWSSISIGEGSKDIRVKIVGNGKEATETLNITMPSEVAQEKKKLFNEAFFSESISGKVNLSTQHDPAQGTEEWTIVFPRTYENIDMFVNKIKAFRLPGAKLFRDVPLTNDFNDDLRARLGVHKNWKIEIVDGKEQGFFLGNPKKELKRMDEGMSLV